MPDHVASILAAARQVPHDVIRENKRRRAREHMARKREKAKVDSSLGGKAAILTKAPK